MSRKHASVLTLRLSDSEAADVEKLKALTGHRTASGALLEAAATYAAVAKAQEKRDSDLHKYRLLKIALRTALEAD